MSHFVPCDSYNFTLDMLQSTYQNFNNDNLKPPDLFARYHDFTMTLTGDLKQFWPNLFHMGDQLPMAKGL